MKQICGSKECYLANIYLLKDNNRNTKKRDGICPKLTIKVPERRRTYFTRFSSVSVVELEKVSVSWIQNKIMEN